MRAARTASIGAVVTTNPVEWDELPVGCAELLFEGGELPLGTGVRVEVGRVLVDATMRVEVRGVLVGPGVRVVGEVLVGALGRGCRLVDGAAVRSMADTVSAVEMLASAAVPVVVHAPAVESSPAIRTMAAARQPGCLVIRPAWHSRRLLLRGSDHCCSGG